MRVALMSLALLAACNRPRQRVVLSCERFGTVIDVRDFGGCGVGALYGTPVDEAQAITYAEQLARSCGVPVRYCAGKPDNNRTADEKK